jgi:hypothetical protein
MPLIYQGQCKACGASAPVETDGYLAFRMDSGKIECLPHPSEFSTLESLGFTFEQAVRDKRFVHVTYLICDQCGCAAERFDAKPHESCIVYVAVILVSFGLAFTFVAMPWALLMGWLSFAAIAKLYAELERYRMHDAQELLPSMQPCPTCGGTNLVAFSKILKKTLCRECGRREVVYKHWVNRSFAPRITRKNER